MDWIFFFFRVSADGNTVGMSPVATEERRMLPLGGGLKRSASFVISVDEVEVFVIKEKIPRGALLALMRQYM